MSSWPRNPRIDRSKLYRERTEPTTATYEDNARIAGEDLTLSDLRHLVEATEGWPRDSSIQAYGGSPYSSRQYIAVVARDSM